MCRGPSTTWALASAKPVFVSACCARRPAIASSLPFRAKRSSWKKYVHVIAAIAEELARKIGTWPPLTVIEPASSFAGPKLKVRGTFRKALFTRISQVSLTVRTCGSALMKPSRTALATWKSTAPAETKTRMKTFAKALAQELCRVPPASCASTSGPLAAPHEPAESSHLTGQQAAQVRCQSLSWSEHCEHRSNVFPSGFWYNMPLPYADLESNMLTGWSLQGLSDIERRLMTSPR